MTTIILGLLTIRFIQEFTIVRPITKFPVNIMARFDSDIRFIKHYL